VPYLGAKKNMMTRADRMTREPNIMKPRERNRCWNSTIVLAVASVGPFKAIMMDPTWIVHSQSFCERSKVSEPRTMHRKQPIQPKKVRLSLRNIDDRIAQMTTDKAPSGVTIIAFVGRG
jgi:hypothetical protein